MDDVEAHRQDRDDDLVRRLAALAGAAPDEDGAHDLLVLASGRASTNGHTHSVDAEAAAGDEAEPALR